MPATKRRTWSSSGVDAAVPMLDSEDSAPLVQAASPTTSPFTLTTIFMVAVYSVLGVFVRVLSGLFTDDVHFFSSDAYFAPNFIGSFIIGFVDASYLKKIAPSTDFGLRSGLCGSLTTYSSWMLATVAAGKIRFASGLVEYITGMTIPFVAFVIGRDFAVMVNVKDDAKPQQHNTLVDKVVLAVSAVLIAGVLALVAVFWPEHRGDVVYTSLFGILGGLTRFTLSTKLNSKDFSLPWGTLLSNLLAFIILTSLYSCSSRGDSMCAYASVGLCGSLSTVSSWVADTVKLRGQANDRYEKFLAYGYAITTSLVGLGIVALTLVR